MNIMSSDKETGIRTQNTQEELKIQYALNGHLLNRIADGYSVCFIDDGASFADVQESTNTFDNASAVYSETQSRIDQIRLVEAISYMQTYDSGFNNSA
jgi:hypothetical protein